MTTDANPRLSEIYRRAFVQSTSGEGKPYYAARDQLLRDLHRDCPAATSAELAAAEAWIHRCCGC